MSNEAATVIPAYATVVTLQQTTEGHLVYVAYHPELPTVISQGDTADEARAGLQEATEMAIEHLVSMGLKIPEPSNYQSGSLVIPPNEQPESITFSYGSSQSGYLPFTPVAVA